MENKFIEIRNVGEIEADALCLVGASTKRNDNTKIGMFGSGNKFALACLIRNNVQLNIYSGLKELKIATVKKTFREQEFNVITVEGDETSLTSEMGKDWVVWQALRELYANAIDEGGFSMTLVDAVDPIVGHTSIYIDFNNKEVQDFIQNIKSYFREEEALYELNGDKVYNKYGNNLNVYRKGIRCNQKDETYFSRFDYDFSNIRINESRLFEYHYKLYEGIMKLLLNSNNSYVVSRFINLFSIAHLQNNNINDYIEFRAFTSSIATVPTTTFNEVWTEQTKGKYFIREYMLPFLNEDQGMFRVHVVPENLYNVLKVNIPLEQMLPPSILSMFGEGDTETASREAKLNAYQQKIFEKAMDFLLDCNYHLLCPVEVVEFASENILGTVDKIKGRILVSVKCLDKGVLETVNTIIEEQVHLKTGYHDETRVFQTALINEMITYMKEKNNIII